MAVFAGGHGAFAGLARFRVSAMRPGVERTGVALGAGDFFGRLVVRQALHVLVAIHAGEHGAVDGVLELVFVDVEADHRAVYVLGEGGIAVAGETVCVLELLRVGGTGKKRKRQCPKKDRSSNIHILRRIRC